MSSDIKTLNGPLKMFVDIKGGNSCIIKNFIYYNMPKNKDDSIPVYSSSVTKDTFLGYIDKNAVDENNRAIKIFNGECILVARNGQAGKMRYIKNGTFTINDHAYVIYPKKKYKERINLKWFSYKFQKLFYDLIIAKDGNGTFNKTYAEKHEIEIPNIEVQLQELKYYDLLTKYKAKIEEIDLKIDNLLDKIIYYENTNEYLMRDVFYIDTGQRITNERLYKNLYENSKNPHKLIPIISSGTENEGIFGYASEEWLKNTFVRKRRVKNEWDAWKNEVGENFIIDEPCITWNTDGNAGTIFYRDYKFFPTDHCGVLIPKEEYKGKINLKFFAYLQKYTFKQNTERGNLHKKEMASQVFELPDIKIQDEIYKEIDKLYKYKEVLSSISKKIDILITKEVVRLDN